jgi:uncharacterized protein with PhoU and TrkA domain
MSNVKENILKMKDMSELIIDLAYSALFLRDKVIAAQVEEMYKNIQELERDTMRLLFKTRESDKDRIVIIEIIDNIKDIAHSAVNISKLIDTELPSIIETVLSETDERIITATISRNSILSNHTIGENRIKENTKANIIAIKRGNSWLFNINKNTKLLQEDLIVATGSEEAHKLFKKVASGEIKKL